MSAGERDPELSSKMQGDQPNESYRLLLGGDVGFITKFPATIIQHTDSLGHSRRILWVDRGADGGLALNFDAFLPNHEIFAEVRDNKLNKHEDAIFGEKLDPDPSTLQIFNKHDDLVLFVHYFNKHFMRIDGDFRLGDTVPVKIWHDNSLPYGTRICMGQPRNSFYVAIDPPGSLPSP